MVRLENPDKYILKGYETHPGSKKYNAILENKITGSVIKVAFGDKNYEQYHDKIGNYSHLNHGDKKRRMLYLARHSKDKNYKYSSGWFSAKMLW
ncbi:hypothetical protein [Flavobacterium sp.]|uniref:DUF5754 family protein n=1 Tax=Flavobacterium sp. TaxID=239 RepID=UPI003752A530